MLFELGIIMLTYIKTVHTARSLRRANADTRTRLSYIVLYNGNYSFDMPDSGQQELTLF